MEARAHWADPSASCHANDANEQTEMSSACTSRHVILICGNKVTQED